MTISNEYARELESRQAKARLAVLRRALRSIAAGCTQAEAARLAREALAEAEAVPLVPVDTGPGSAVDWV